MCNNNDNNTNQNCIMEILQVICVLQTNACPDNCLLSCDRPALGGGPTCPICNTRPVMIYTCCANGAPLSLPTTKVSTSEEVSNVFRVEKISGNCCTFRVLIENTDASTGAVTYTSTNSLFTIDCGCICLIRCLNDTYVECL